MSASRSAGVARSAAPEAASGSSTRLTSEMCARSEMCTSVAKVPRRGYATTMRSLPRRFNASRIGVRPMPSSALSRSSLIGSPGLISSITNWSRIAA